MSAQQMASCNSEMTAPGPCQDRNRDSTSNAKHAQLEDAVHSVRVYSVAAKIAESQVQSRPTMSITAVDTYVVQYGVWPYVTHAFR